MLRACIYERNNVTILYISTLIHVMLYSRTLQEEQKQQQIVKTESSF